MRSQYLNMVLLVVSISCVTPKVMYDYDTKENFDKYKTFNFFIDSGEGLSKLDIKRVQNSISDLLIAKGLEQTSDPTFYINVIAKRQDSRNQNTFGVGLGAGSHSRFGISGGIPMTSREPMQRLIIDFVASKNDHVIWQGELESKVISDMIPEERDTYYRKITEKILSKYPPK